MDIHCHDCMIHGYYADFHLDGVPPEMANQISSNSKIFKQKKNKISRQFWSLWREILILEFEITIIELKIDLNYMKHPMNGFGGEASKFNFFTG